MQGEYYHSTNMPEYTTVLTYIYHEIQTKFAWKIYPSINDQLLNLKLISNPMRNVI